MLKLVENTPPPALDPTVPRAIVGDSENVCRWVEQQLGLPAGHFQGCMAIGVIYHNNPVAAVVFSNYVKHRETGLVTIEATIAATDVRWCTKGILRVLFRYPFVHLGATRLQVVCRRKNREARNFVERLGFKLEGVGRRAWDGKQDAVMYSMLPRECKWTGDGDG